MNRFDQALDLLMRPGHTVTSALSAGLKGENVFGGAWKGLSGQERVGYGDILREQGVPEGLGRSVAGFVGDVALDPLTYVGVGPVRKAGSLAVKGVERALLKPGVEALEAARGLKTAQAARILTKGAELKPTAIVGGLPEGVRLATGGAKVGMDAAKIAPTVATEAGRHSLIGGWAPRLSPEKLERLVVSAGRAAPEVKALSRELPSIALKGPQGERLLGRGFAAKQTGQVLEGGKSSVPALQKLEATVKRGKSLAEAPNAIKFGPIPLIKTETLKAPIKAAWEGLKKVPVLGAGARAVGKAGEATGKFAATIFQRGAGLTPEERAAQESAIDLMHLRMRKEVDFAESIVDELKKAGYKDEAGLAKAREEVSKTMEGVLVKALEMERPAAAVFIEAEVAHLGRKLKKLTGETKGMEGVAAKLGTIAERLKAFKESGGVEQSVMKSIGRQETKIRTQAEGLAKREAQIGLKTTKEGDLIGRIASTGSPLILDKEAVKHIAPDVLKELIHGKAVKISKKLLGGGTDLEEIAVKGGVESVMTQSGFLPREEGADYARNIGQFLEALTKAGEARALARRKIADVSAELPYATERTFEKTFRQGVEQGTIDLEKKVAGLQKKIATLREGPKRLALEQELSKTQKAIEIGRAKAAPQPVLYERRVPYGGAPAPLQNIASKISNRLAEMHAQEQRLLTLPPETREFYLPHYLKPEMEQALRATVYGANPERIMRSGVTGASVKAALRRTTRKGVTELTLADMIHGGMIDPDKLAKVLAEKGIPFSAADRLVFEQDPVVAALRRGLSSARAVSAAEMRDEIMNSPTFLKSKVNLLKEGDLQDAEGILATHPDHAVYVTARDYIQHFMSEAERESLRAGNRPELVRALAVKLGPDDLEKLAKRVGPETAKVEGYVLPTEIVQHLNKAHEIQFMPEAVGNFLKFYDSVQHLFTTGATVIRPGFHIRNEIGNLWNMMLAGARNPATLYVAQAMQRGKFAGLKPIAGLQPEEVWKLFQEFGGQRSGWAGAAEDIVKRATSPSKNILSPQGPWARAGAKAGGAIEDNAKLALFIDGLQKGMDPKSAMWRSKKFLFDYNDLSWTEKTVFKRFAPFYAWSRKNIPLQIEQLITNPGKVGALGHAREAADRDFDELDRPVVADWIQKSLGVPFKKNDDGSISYALMGGLIPTADLARIDSKQLISMLSPLVKVPLEQMFNEDWFKGRPISRFPGPIPGAGEMVEFMGIPMPARLAHLVRNATIIAQVDRALFSEDAGVGGWSNLIFGVKPYKQFPERQYKSYFYRQEKERHGLEQEAEKQKGLGNEYIADQLAGRAETLQGRAMTAKGKALELNPLAFTPKPSARPQLAPTSMQQFKARIKGQVAKMYGGKRMAR